MKQIRIQWLIDSHFDSSHLENAPELPAVRLAPSRQGTLLDSYNESACLEPGVFIFHAKVIFRQTPPAPLIEIGDFSSQLDEVALMVRSVEQGRCLQMERSPELTIACEPGIDLFRYADHFSFIAACHAGEDVESTSLCLYRSRLDQLLGGEHSQAMLQALALRQNPSLCARAIPRHVSLPLRQAMHTPYCGRMRQLAAQAKVLEYLCTLSTHLLDDHKPLPEQSLRRSVVRDLHDKLLNLDGKLPPLAEIAREYEIPARSLNEQFKKEFGLSIVAFVTDHRLRAAHAALSHSRIAIKTLAARLGYAHPNHFTSAFTRKFGYPPGKLRRIPH